MQNSKKTIIQHLPAYLDYMEIEQGLSPKTLENYSRFLNKFSGWLKKSNLKNLRPHELTADHIYKYKTFLTRRGSSDKPAPPAGGSPAPLMKTTQNYYLIALRNLLKYFTDKDINALPADKIKLLRDKSDKQIKFLKLEQIETLLSSPDTGSLDGLRDKAILETLFSTGLRVAELTALDREQLKIKKGVEYLEISIKGKGGRIRTVYFSLRAVEALKSYLNARNDMDKALFISYSKNALKNENKRLSVRSIENIVKKYLKLAGLPVMMSPHSLRHSYATDLLSNGVDLRLVQEFLGHRNIATTQIYTHVTNKQLGDVHRKFHGGNRLNKN
ncbi:MAG: tyrosine-type recombinase/integrase [Patescibacteria group bacterium]|jgi:site-specific recombinase XerD